MAKTFNNINLKALLTFTHLKEFINALYSKGSTTL